MIADLPVPHLDQLPSQPAQLEESRHHPAGVVIHVDTLLQTHKTLLLQYCALYPDPKTLSRVASVSCTQGIEQVLNNFAIYDVIHTNPCHFPVFDKTCNENKLEDIIEAFLIKFSKSPKVQRNP